MVGLVSLIQIAYTINEIVKELKNPNQNHGHLEKEMIGNIGNKISGAVENIREEEYRQKYGDGGDEQSGIIVNNNF